jgi:hypothetical protein
MENVLDVEEVVVGVAPGVVHRHVRDVVEGAIDDQERPEIVGRDRRKEIEIDRLAGRRPRQADVIDHPAQHRRTHRLHFALGSQLAGAQV